MDAFSSKKNKDAFSSKENKDTYFFVATTALASAISLAPGVPIFLKRKLREFSSITSFLSSWGEYNITEAPERNNKNSGNRS